MITFLRKAIVITYFAIIMRNPWIHSAKLNSGSLEMSQVVLVVKTLLVNAGDTGNLGSIPGLGRSPGKGNGSPLQYSCLEISMDGGSQWAAVGGVANSPEHLSTGSFQCLAAQAGLLPVMAWTPCRMSTRVGVEMNITVGPDLGSSALGADSKPVSSSVNYG